MPTAMTDDVRRRDLRRAKTGATGLLVLAAVTDAATYVVGGQDVDGGLGFVRAAAEAGMVGGLADWFAVTALFRRPLGLPIPHTALIPTRKDAIGESLGSFVGDEFLASEVVRSRLRSAAVARRIAGWLVEEAHATRVVDEAALLVSSAIAVLRDEDVRAVLGTVLEDRVAGVSVGPLIGKVLGPLVADQAHHGLTDVIVDRAVVWLRDNREQVLEVVEVQAPGWSPRFVDRAVAKRVYGELLRVAEAVAADPDHELRATFDTLLAKLARDLSEDAATIAKVDAVVASLVARPEARQAFGDALSVVRRLVVELVEDPASALRQRANTAVADFGRRVVADDALSAKLEGWLEQAVVHVTDNYRDELTTVITETVARWDAEETSRKLELQVGRDLQFIRVNGTVVGSLAGVVIHAVSLLL